MQPEFGAVISLAQLQEKCRGRSWRVASVHHGEMESGPAMLVNVNDSGDRVSGYFSAEALAILQTCKELKKPFEP
jgi:hypothetical protein